MRNEKNMFVIDHLGKYKVKAFTKKNVKANPNGYSLKIIKERGKHGRED